MADGRCLLLFDGLDEIADRQVRMRLARSLAELARLYSGNRVVIGRFLSPGERRDVGEQLKAALAGLRAPRYQHKWD